MVVPSAFDGGYFVIDGRCGICKQTGASFQTTDKDGLIYVTTRCPTCGDWKGAFDLVGPHLSDPANARLMPCLAAHIRQQNAAGERVVELTAENWREFAEQHASTPIVRRQDLLLRWFGKSDAGAFIDL